MKIPINEINKNKKLNYFADFELQEDLKLYDCLLNEGFIKWQ